MNPKVLNQDVQIHLLPVLSIVVKLDGSPLPTKQLPRLPVYNSQAFSHPLAAKLYGLVPRTEKIINRNTITTTYFMFFLSLTMSPTSSPKQRLAATTITTR